MDIQRTVLWVVFSLSLLLLWDNWMRYNGRPSMFFPTPASQQVAPAATGVKPDVPQATGVAVLPASSAPATGAAPVKGEIITITTDVTKAEIDTAGGELRRLELLKHRDAA